MKKLIVGFITVLGGAYLFVKSYFYAWVSDSIGAQAEPYEKYQFLSKILGYSSCILMAGGSLLVYFSIRKMNQEYRDKLKRNHQPEENKNP